MTKLEPIHVGNCPVCQAFPVQHIAAAGDSTAFKFLTPRNAAHPVEPAMPVAGAGLEWSATLCNGERVKHAAAEKACAALGEGWRLPTRAELLSLVDDTRTEPAIDTERFPDTKSGAYWATTPFASDSSYAWFVDFLNGYSYLYRRGSDDAFVRAVRSVPAGQ